jgi:thymidylate synthase
VTATTTWRELLHALLSRGDEVSPVSSGADWKGRTTKELLGYQSRWDMSRPVIACPRRKLGYRFMTAEAAWVLGGDNRLSTIKPYSKAIHRFSDDGRTFNGAYGPPFVEQAAWIVQTLAKDRGSRQAVATIWRPRPGLTNDTPCTVALQWMIRKDLVQTGLRGDDGGTMLIDKLHCIATMRSSDAWTGIPYDVFTFSMMSAYIAIALRQYQEYRWKRSADQPQKPAPVLPLSLGVLHLTSGSQHLYKADWTDAVQCRDDVVDLHHIEAIPLDSFPTTDDLISHLWDVARNTGHLSPHAWLGKLTGADK